MNSAGHAFVTVEVNPAASDALVFGSMAPDYLKIDHLARNTPITHPELRAGVKLHYATDNTFEGHPRFLMLQDVLAEDVRPLMGSKVARMIGHVASEILLDGYVLQKKVAADAYVSALKAAERGDFPAAELATDPEKFVENIKRRADYGAPYFYQEPLIVAHRLHARLRGRKTEFGEDLINDLAEILYTHQDRLAPHANSLIADTIAVLKGPNDTSIDIGPVLPILPGVASVIKKIEPVDESQLTITEIEAMRLRTTEKRRAEFASGTVAMRETLTVHGSILSGDILRADSGAPVIPEGYKGSIAHSGEWVAAVSTPSNHLSGIGVDIESLADERKKGFDRAVATPEELESFENFGRHAAVAIASAKESIFKAMNPLVKKHFGFLEIILLQDRGGVSIEPATDRTKGLFDGVSIGVSVVRDSRWVSSLCVVE